MYSYPNLLAQQFALVGGGIFTQPSYEDDVNNLGGFMLGGSPILINNVNQYPTRLIIDANQLNPDGSVGAPENIAGVSTVEISNLQKSAYNNMGVPGAKSFHLLAPGYGNVAGVTLGQSNPYFVRHATTPSATVLGDAMSKAPTFFTNWIGNNDVLSYATSGGTGADHNVTGNTNPATYGSNDITNANTFTSVYSTIVNTLTVNGAKGVVCTIPSVTSIPFFTTVPYNPLTAKTIGQGNQAAGTAAIGQLNAQLYGPLKQALTAFGAGNRISLLNPNTTNPLLIKDETLTNLSAQLTAAFTPSLGAATAAFYGNVFGQARQATFSDRVLLRTRLVIGTAPDGVPAPLDKFGITYPLQDQHILIPSELTAIANATNAYNASIKAIAASKNLAVADMNIIMNSLASGLQVESGQIYTANYFSGTTTESKVLFSLDGVHPNARGYAVIANEIIKVINAKYKSNLPLHIPSYFPGINILGSN
jgi:lysophospholipase L1-like esterase